MLCICAWCIHSLNCRNDISSHILRILVSSNFTALQAATKTPNTLDRVGTMHEPHHPRRTQRRARDTGTLEKPSAQCGCHRAKTHTNQMILGNVYQWIAATVSEYHQKMSWIFASSGSGYDILCSDSWNLPCLKAIDFIPVVLVDSCLLSCWIKQSKI